MNQPTPYLDVNSLVGELLARVQTILGEHLIGMYLDGSLASDPFDQDSDIDFVVVTEFEITEDPFSSLYSMHADLSALDSIWAIQLEGTYISAQALRRYDPANARVVSNPSNPAISRSNKITSGRRDWAFSCAEDFLEMTTDAVIIANQAHTRHIDHFLASTVTKRPLTDRAEVTGRRKDGSEFPGEASIAKINHADQTLFAVILRDITWRKQAEKDLSKWANASEHAEWGAVIGEADSNQLQVMNPAFARMYGYTIAELTGKAILEVYAPENRDKVPGWIQLAHKKGHIRFEARRLRKNGTIFPALVEITAVKDSNGAVLYRVVNVQGIFSIIRGEVELDFCQRTTSFSPERAQPVCRAVFIFRY